MQNDNNNPYRIDDVKPKSFNTRFAAGAVTFSLGAIALSQLFNPALAQALVGTFGQPVQSVGQTISQDSGQTTPGQTSASAESNLSNSSAESNSAPIAADSLNSTGKLLVAESLQTLSLSSAAGSPAVAASGVAAPKPSAKPFLNSISLPTASDQTAGNLSSATPYGSNSNGGSKSSGGTSFGGKSSSTSNARYVGDHESENEHFSKASERNDHESDDHDDEGEDD